MIQILRAILLPLNCLKRVIFALLSTTTITSLSAAELFESLGTDGVTRYSSSRLDDSYRSVESMLEIAPAATSSRPGKQARTSAQAPGHLRIAIELAAAQHGLSPALLNAIVRIESGFNPSAISPKGALGPMQLMPGTAKMYGVNRHVALEDPVRNIDAGARHLKHLMNRHSGSLPLALAAYNAGSGPISKLGGRIPPYKETMLYVAAVLAAVKLYEDGEN